MLMNWRGIRANWLPGTEYTDIVQDSFQLSFADMLGSDLKYLKFFQF